MKTENITPLSLAGAGTVITTCGVMAVAGIGAGLIIGGMLTLVIAWIYAVVTSDPYK